MRDALVLMNARDIPACQASVDALDIPVIYMHGYTEYQIMREAFPEVLGHDFDWLWLASDDLVIPPLALEAVRQLRDTGWAPVVTGYSQFSFTDWRINLTSEPLSEQYDGECVFRQFADVIDAPHIGIRTWFAGMSLTGMTRDMWRDFPFRVDGDPGWQSDLNLSRRLQNAGIPIIAARDGFCLHWRHHNIYGQDPRDEVSRVNLADRHVYICDPDSAPLLRALSAA